MWKGKHNSKHRVNNEVKYNHMDCVYTVRQYVLYVQIYIIPTIDHFAGLFVSFYTFFSDHI